jgi:hypothetical protein
MGMTFASPSSSTRPTPAGPFGRARASLLPRPAPEPSRAPNSEADARDAGPSRASSPAHPDHDFSRVAVYGDAARDSSGGSGREAAHLGIASTGAPTVRITYKPEAADKSTKIVFIQVVQVSLDGTPIKPGTADAKFAHLDADTTDDFYAVDHSAGEADPYYNGDDAALDGGTQGNATTTPAVNATMGDTPSYPETSFPAGKKTFLADFHAIAFSAAGADKGKFYSYAHWSYTKPKGKGSTIMHLNTSTNTSLPKSKAAINLWCTNHGFVLPT